MIFLSIKYSNKKINIFGLQFGKYPDKVRLKRIGKLL